MRKIELIDPPMPTIDPILEDILTLASAQLDTIRQAATEGKPLAKAIDGVYALSLRLAAIAELERRAAIRRQKSITTNVD